MGHLPHRYPMLMIDRLLHYSDDVAVGVKQLSENEWMFQGHLPADPCMPTGLLLESMGQVGAAAILTRPENANMYLFLAGMDKVEVHRNPKPGECLTMEARLLRYRGQSGRTRVECKSDLSEALVAVAEYTFVIGSDVNSPSEAEG